MTRKLLALAAISTTAALAVSPALASPAAHSKPKKVPKVTVVTVKAFEYGYTLSRKTVPRGPVTFMVKNTGTTAHDFYVSGGGATGKTPYLGPGQSTKLKLVFKSKGIVRYSCTVPRHADLGMKGTLTVK